MAIDYAVKGFGFVDSVHGTAANQAIKSLVPQIVDTRLQWETHIKCLWEKSGLIGGDNYVSGDVWGTAPGFPLIRKTQLQTQSGETIKMGLGKNLDYSVNTGRVLGQQQVDFETVNDIYNDKVQVEEYSHAVRFDNTMDAQRNPFDPFESIASKLLTDHAAQMMDTSYLFALHYGYAPHQFRAHGHTKLPPTECTNVIFGNDKNLGSTGKTIADLATNGDDNFNAETFELGELEATEMKLAPCIYDGEEIWVWLISPRAAFVLNKDPRYELALRHARERSPNNPLFKRASIKWSKSVAIEYDKIRTVAGARNPASLTVSGNTISESDYTGLPVGLTADKIHQSYMLGANSLMIAEGQLNVTGLVRAENDYNRILGRAYRHIWGAKRTNYKSETENAAIGNGFIKFINTTMF